MAHTEQQVFEFGNTIQVKASVQKAKAHEFAESDTPSGDYTHQSVVGVDDILYNENVGNGEAKWVEIDKGLDIGAILAKVKELEGQLKGQKMYVGRLKRQLQSLGASAPDMEKEGKNA